MIGSVCLVSMVLWLDGPASGCATAPCGGGLV